MIRVNVLAEGQTEMSFVKSSLNNYFRGQIILDSRRVLTSRDNHISHEYRGGMINYLKAKNDILHWTKAHTLPQCLISFGCRLTFLNMLRQ